MDLPAVRGPIRLLIIDECQVGFPIRTSRDRRVLSPPPGLSQSATSFIASCCQGIHQTPLSRLIRSRRRRALLRAAGSTATRSCSGRKSTRPDGFRHRRRPAGRLSVSVIDLERLLSSARGSRDPRPRRPPHSANARQRLVFCSLHDVKLPRSSDRTGRTTARLVLPMRSKGLVGRGGVEPPTSRLSGVRSNHLSYRPQSRGGRLAPRLLVEPTGIEPVTSCLQSTRSPS